MKNTPDHACESLRMDEADRSETAPLDDLELQAIVARWSDLSRDVKDAVLALCSKGVNDEP